ECRGALGHGGVVAGDVAEDVGTAPQRPLRVVPGVAQLLEPEALVGDQPPRHPEVGAALDVEPARTEALELGAEALELGHPARHRRLPDVGEDTVETVVAGLPADGRARGEVLADGAVDERGQAIAELGHGARSLAGAGRWTAGQRLDWLAV